MPLRRMILVLVLALAGACGLPSFAPAQDSVWNLRTPEWKAAWADLPADGDHDLKLIAVASQLVAYSGVFLPVGAVAPGIDAGLQPGHVPVELAWFEAPDGVLAFGVASGWGHHVLGHVPLADPGTPQDVAAWNVGVRYGRDDARAGDAWAGRFLAEFGHPVEPLLALLCDRDEGPRAAAIADAYEAVVGWRPQAACGGAPATVAAPVASLLDCDERHHRCRSEVEETAGVCYGACIEARCALSCSSGSYEQCSTCTGSCSRACNSTAAGAWHACDEALDVCQAQQ